MSFEKLGVVSRTEKVFYLEGVCEKCKNPLHETFFEPRKEMMNKSRGFSSFLLIITVVGMSTRDHPT